MSTLTKADKLEWARHKRMVRKAERSVEVLARFIEKGSETKQLREAAQMELNRLQRALVDLKLLKEIFQRGKG